MPLCFLRHMVPGQPLRPRQGLVQIPGAVEVDEVQDLAEASLDAHDHAVGLQHLGLGLMLPFYAV